MTKIIQDVVAPLLRANDWRFFQDVERDCVIALLSPPGPDVGSLALVFQADDELEEASLSVELCTAPPARRAAVAALIAELNAGARFIKFSMNRGSTVFLSIDVELTHSDNAPALIGLAIGRIMASIKATFDRIIQTAYPKKKQPPSRVEREVGDILRQAQL